MTRVGSITGQVVGADTGHPLRHAQLTLINGAGNELTANADDSGVFLFRDVPEGRYWLRAEKEQWLRTYLGQKDVGDSPKSILLAPGQNISGLQISLLKLGVITGRVLDKYSEGVEGATVIAVGAEMRLGHTDDRGDFRIPHLLPGRFILLAVPRPYDAHRGHRPVYGPTFATSAVDPQTALPVTVVPGEVGPVDIVLAEGKVTTVNGELVSTTGTAGEVVNVTLNIEASNGWTRSSIEWAVVTAGENGRFRFVNVPQGSYRVRARSATHVGASDVRVTGESEVAVTVTLVTPTRIRGEVIIETQGKSSCVGPTVIAVPLDNTGDDQRPLVAHVRTDGAFELPALAGSYQLEIRCRDAKTSPVITRMVAGSFGARNGIVDASTLPSDRILRVFTSLPSGQIVGSVLDREGKTCAGGTVVAVTNDRRRWHPAVRYLWTAIVTNGRYELPALPPGSYTVWHEPPRRIGEISRPEYLERVIPRGQTVRLAELAITELPVYCS